METIYWLILHYLCFSSVSKHILASSRRSTILLLGLLFSYIFCVGFISVYHIIVLCTGNSHVKYQIIVYMIYWVHYGINFILYGAINKSYRKAFKVFFHAILKYFKTSWVIKIVKLLNLENIQQLFNRVVRLVFFIYVGLWHGICVSFLLPVFLTDII